MASPHLQTSLAGTSLTPEDRRQRRAALLHPLNNTLIAISMVGLLIMLVRGSVPIAFAVVGLSLLLNLVVALLVRRGLIQAAALLFCLWSNFGLLLLSAINFVQEANQISGLVFICVISMSVTLAGLLLSVRTAFLTAIFNSVAAIVLLWIHYSRFGTNSPETPLYAAFSTGVPVASLLMISAVITWLYQRALDASEARLEQARRRVMEAELLRRDLAIARELQQRLYPPPPLTDGLLTVASRSEPARETSGDFYDFIDLDEHQLGIVVADVTGKSIAAALMMALARGTLRSAARRHSSPAAVLADANEALCRDHSARQLITVFYGVLDLRTLDLRFANAGHPYPFLRRDDTLDELELGGLPLGARADARYAERSLRLLAGDQLFLLSDGLIEERNATREMFGYERLIAVMQSADRHSPQRAIEDLWNAVATFRGATEQDDDITLLVVQAASVAEPEPSQQRDGEGAEAERRVEV